MTQFKTEGQPAFPLENKENDNSAASSTGEETNAGSDQSQAGQENAGGEAGAGEKGKENFADHPRWKERETDWSNRFNQQETRHTEELGKLREDLETFKKGSATKQDATPDAVPAWFGGDDKAWQEFKVWNEQQLNTFKGAAVEAVETKSSAEQKAVDEATKYFEDTIGTLEADKTLNPKGEKIDRNKLLKFTIDNDLVDSKGRWNYKAALLLMKGTATDSRAAATQEKKDIAGATVADRRSESAPSTVATSADFKKAGSRPW